jgi:predicted RecA/RadA family phage recombinase
LITVTAANNTTSGDLVVMEYLVGVAAFSCDKGEALTIATEGVFELPKIEAESVKLGMKVRVDKGLISLSDKGVVAGISLEDAAAGSKTVKVKLCS